MVVVEAGGNGVWNAGAEGGDTAYAEIPGQPEDGGQIEPMPLIEVAAPALAPQVEIVRGKRGEARSVVERVRKRVMRQQLHAPEQGSPETQREAVVLRAAVGLEPIDIGEIRVWTNAGRRQRSVGIAQAVQPHPAQKGVLRRCRCVMAQLALHAHAGLEGRGGADARVRPQHAGRRQRGQIEKRIGRIA